MSQELCKETFWKLLNFADILESLQVLSSTVAEESRTLGHEFNTKKTVAYGCK